MYQANFSAKRTLLSVLLVACLPSLCTTAVADGLYSDYDAVPPVISVESAGDKPNVMIILDNSNSMDEAPDGHAVGSQNFEGLDEEDHPGKSRIARHAVKDIITSYSDSIRLGLMAYDQDNVSHKYLHDSQYDVSFVSGNYPDPKEKRVDNPTAVGYINYNVALPFYAGTDQGNAFCYSASANFGTGSATGPWDRYTCYSKKTGNVDNGTADMGGTRLYNEARFGPTDSDLALGIYDFGTYLTWQGVDDTWFSNESPGEGKVHVEIDDLDSDQIRDLNYKLAMSTVDDSDDYDDADDVKELPLRNAGLTPIEGALDSADTYFRDEFRSPNICPEPSEYVILITDGLPSTDKDGDRIIAAGGLSVAEVGIAAAAAAAKSLYDGDPDNDDDNRVITYVIGFALNATVDEDLFNTIATAGGSDQAYYADDEDELNDALREIFQLISNRESSGTGASILANNSQGVGAYYQALYVPLKEDEMSPKNKVTWVGVLNSLFLDSYGYLREDSNGDATLGNYDEDKIVEYFYDGSQTLVQLKSSTDTATPAGLADFGAAKELEQINYIWNARDQLANVSELMTPRSYSDIASNGRAIYTSLDGSSLIGFTRISDLADAEDDAAVVVTSTGALVPGAQLSALGAEDTKNASYQAAYDPVYDAAIAALKTVAVAEAEASAVAEIDPTYLADLALYNAKLSFLNERVADFNAATAAFVLAESNHDNATGLSPYMDLSDSEADKVIQWVRGEDVSGYRTRQFDWNNDGVAQPWILGDIIHSTPVSVGPPAKRYDITNGDNSYADFVKQYADRRHVIYAGANDGMLHAFNGGFWNDSAKSYGTGSPAHQLGSELWAYVPKSLLPHLQWLTDVGYAHTYYVDGEPVSFDANIFADDDDHPNGWGTILAVPMRFGGGTFSVDIDGDGDKETALRSSISLFDITNPENPPILLDEISHPNMGFTTSKPTLVKSRASSEDGYDADSSDRWLLAFGSGPTELDDATSNQNARLFLYDLETLSFASGYAPYILSDTNSYIGDIGVADWDDDYIDDTLYFGVNKGYDLDGDSDNTETGRIVRLRLASVYEGADDVYDENDWLVSPAYNSDTLSGISTFMDIERTSIGAPLTKRDENGRRWVYSGTGRLFTTEDNSSDMQQRYYGVMEPVDSEGAESMVAVDTSNLEDSSDINVYTTGAVDRNGSVFSINSTEIENFNQLEYAISKYKGGWMQELTRESGSSNPSGRNINGTASFQKLMLYSEYEPSGSVCSPEGNSKLHAVYYKTGTAPGYDIVDRPSSDPDYDPDDPDNPNPGAAIDTTFDLEQGLTSTPVIIDPPGDDAIALIKKTTGELEKIVINQEPILGSRESWREINMDGIDL